MQYIVTISFVEKEDTLYAKSGHVNTYHQIIVPNNTLNVEIRDFKNKVEMSNTDNCIVLYTEKVRDRD